MNLFPWKRSPSLASLAQSAAVRTLGKRHRITDIELLVWIGGAAAEVSEALASTLGSLAAVGPEIALTFLIDGPEWERRARPLLKGFPERREILLKRATDLPALLYSRALAEPGPVYVAFLWPGCRLDAQGLRSLLAASEGADLVHGDLAAGVPPELAPPVQHGWLQILDPIPWNGCLVARRAFGAAGSLAVSPVFQRLFAWDFMRRLTRDGARIVAAPVPRLPARWSWADFPFGRPFREDPGLLRRCLPAEIGGGEEVRWADLNPEERERLRTALEDWHRAAGIRPPELRFQAAFQRGVPGRWPLRVLVLGGPYEPHHNQLTFYGFFDRLRGRGYLSWQAGLYSHCRPEDLEGHDLVVFTRPRYPECTALLDHCRARRIPTLVMMDDNWIAAGREFPRYAALFTPGKPAFEVFLDALRRATAVLCFNPVLEEDLRPYARRVLRIPHNIEMDLFPLRPASPAPERSGLLVGYAGSPRFESAGFHALARFVQERPDVRLFLMVHQIPAELAAIPPERIELHPFTLSYIDYARTLSTARPDILLAPLDDSRFSASKCPNKFLEIAAVEAAGIYSRLPPYTDFVRDGETGLLVDNDAAFWRDALERLYNDPALRRRLGEQARREADERYSTRTLLPVFLDMLQEAVRLPVVGRRRQEEMGKPARAKILYLSHLATLSGAEQALLRLVSHLDRSRFEPLVVLPEDGPLRERIEALSIRTRILPIGWWIPATHWSAADFRSQLEGLEERARALSAFAEEEEVDLIHSNSFVTLEGAVAAARLGLPHLWHSRGLFGEGFPPSYFDDVGFFFAGIDSLSDTVVCVSQGVADQASRFCRLARRLVIPDGFDTAAFLARPVGSRDELLRRYGIAEAGEPARLVASLGGIQRRKGQIDLVEAMALLLDDFPEVILILGGGAGDAEYLATVEARIAELGLQKTVLLVGFEPDVRTLLAHAEMLVHPSHSEGFGLAILDAMAAGKPVVATRCGGPEEVVEDGVSGLLVPVADPPALAGALRRLLSDRQAAESMGTAAARRALEFSLESTARRTEEVYETLLKEAPEESVRQERTSRAAEVMAEALARVTAV